MSHSQPPPPITLNSSNENVLNEGIGTAMSGELPAGGALPASARRTPPPPLRPSTSSSRILTPQSPIIPHPPSAASSPRNPVYQNQTPIGSSELLLPPSSTPRLPRFHPPYLDSPASSRRSSWSSDAGPFATMFDDSRNPSRSGTPDPTEPVGMQTIAEKYNITPYAGLLLYPNDKEDDDDLHDPATGMAEDRECNIFTKRGLVNVGGLALVVTGILVLFIGYPVLTFVRDVTKPEPDICQLGNMCLDVGDIPLLKNFRQDLVDPDTPEDAFWKKSSSGKQYKLVFSDEFNKDGRTFYPGEDSYWEAVDIHYAATQDLEWYDPDAITTKDGVLEIEFAAHSNHQLDYRSGMLQSWNKLCFKGGIIEASVSLPGRGDISGLWPGFWTMGNLGRPGYLATTEGMWPYSYHDGCDAGITANQSSPDGISFLPGMRLPGCTCEGEDHPNRGTARSSPEIDAIEASVGSIDKAKTKVVGVVSQSAQVAPFDLWYQPDYDHFAVYDPTITTINAYRGGFFQQALSGLSVLNNDWYDGKAYQTYGFEYEPGEEGMIEWSIGDTKTWRMNAAATGPNGNIGARPIPKEPMSIIMNCGMSSTFAYVQYAELAKLLPAKMRIDWVRIYQDEDCEDCSVTCDPPGYPTTEYIEKHREAYDNRNLTSWDAANFPWPKNELVDGC